ncbi:MAG: TetR/AcrR family transcriptional regulator [Pseudorhodoplanes sp.]
MTKPPARASAKRRAKPERPAKQAKRGAKRVRLTPQARSGLILRGAIRFFAERGFQGQTRDLAEQLGISTGLLFRYFPTKDALIDRIYETLFERRWKPEWDEILGNRSRDLRERLIDFYLDYSQMLHDYEWGRIYLYSGLGGAGIAQRFARMVTDRVYARVVGELRHEFGRPDLSVEPMSEPEVELMWSLHGSIFYIGLRKWVYNVGGPSDIPGTVTQIVERFYTNAGELMRQRAQTKKPPTARRLSAS